MTPWQERIYALPDDGGQTLGRLLDSLPSHLAAELTLLPYGGYRLRVADAKAALFLKMAVAGLEIADSEHAFLIEGELFVPDGLRDQCEQELATRCVTSALWAELLWVEFRGLDACAVFEEALGRSGCQ